MGHFNYKTIENRQYINRISIQNLKFQNKNKQKTDI